MGRTPGRAVGLVIVGLLVLGPAAEAGATTSTTSPAQTAVPSTVAPETSLAWLSTEARPANGRLNRDQVAIVDITRSSGETSAGTFFTRLRAACRSMLLDAKRAARLPAAPAATLENDWKAMTAATSAYASDCLTLTRTRSNASFTVWNDSLRPMNLASINLNTLVQQIRTAG